MKPLEGIWWEMVPPGVRHYAWLQGHTLPGVRAVMLAWGAPGEREWQIHGMVGAHGHSWHRTLARGPWSPGEDPREAALEWCRLHLAPTVRAHRAAQTRRRKRWAQGRKDEEEA